MLEQKQKASERPEEEHVRTALENVLPDANFRYEPNDKSTSPDYEVTCGNTRASLEVTIVSNGAIIHETNGDCQFYNRDNYEHSTRQRFERKIIPPLEPLQSLLANNERLFLLLLTPLPKTERKSIVSEINRELPLLIEKALKENLVPREYSTQPLKINFKSPALCKIDLYCYIYCHPYGQIDQRIGFHFLCNPSLIGSDLMLQAQYCIKTAIENKEKKMSTLKEPKWLAIFNHHPLIENQTFCEAYSLLIDEGLQHSFSRIFIIDLEKKVLELPGLSH